MKQKVTLTGGTGQARNYGVQNTKVMENNPPYAGQGIESYNV
jgi:hypothetical protein